MKRLDTVKLQCAKESEDCYVFFCREFDIRAQGESPEAAFENLLDVFVGEVYLSLKKGNFFEQDYPAPSNGALRVWRIVTKTVNPALLFKDIEELDLSKGFTNLVDLTEFSFFREEILSEGRHGTKLFNKLMDFYPFRISNVETANYWIEITNCKDYLGNLVLNENLTYTYPKLEEDDVEKFAIRSWIKDTIANPQLYWRDYLNTKGAVINFSQRDLENLIDDCYEKIYPLPKILRDLPKNKLQILIRANVQEMLDSGELVLEDTSSSCDGSSPSSNGTPTMPRSWIAQKCDLHLKIGGNEEKLPKPKKNFIEHSDTHCTGGIDSFDYIHGEPKSIINLDDYGSPNLTVSSGSAGSMDFRRSGVDRREEDIVNDPSHYTKGGIEVLEFLKSWDMDFSLGNAVKYIVRSPHKGKQVEDLAKALFYVAFTMEENGGSEEITKFAKRWLEKKTMLTKRFKKTDKEETFEEAWKRAEAKGYQYGEYALDAAKTGWLLAKGDLCAPVRSRGRVPARGVPDADRVDEGGVVAGAPAPAVSFAGTGTTRRERNVSDHYRLYLRIVDSLRARRANPGWVAEDDRTDLALLEDLFAKLEPSEQERANAEGWRSWPDLYDAHMEEHLVERPELLPDDTEPARLARPFFKTYSNLPK